MNTSSEFINEGIQPLPEDILSDTKHTIHGYNLRCVKCQIKGKRKWTIEERWFCLKSGNGLDLPDYVRNGSKRTGYKTYNSLFASIGFYKASGIPGEWFQK